MKTFCSFILTLLIPYHLFLYWMNARKKIGNVLWQRDLEDLEEDIIQYQNQSIDQETALP